MRSKFPGYYHPDKDEFDKDTHTRHIKHIKKMFDVSAV